MAVRDSVAIALLVVALASAALNVYLFQHRTIRLGCDSTTMQLSDTEIHASPDADVGAVHAFPEGRPVCTFADTICWTRI